MKGFKILFITTFLLVTSLNLIGQVHDSSIRQVVLNNNVNDSLYVFGQWNETDGTETHLRYLGLINNNEGKFKIMTSSWFWGQSKRATSRILVYNDKNKYMGNYYVETVNDLPEKIENNHIMFLNSQSDKCDEKAITRLSFENGIPKKFFLECKEGYGEIYSFNKE